MSTAHAGLRCVLFAVRRESMYFRRLCGPLERLADAPCEATLGGTPHAPLLIVETGVGRSAVEKALDWLLRQGDDTGEPAARAKGEPRRGFGSPLARAAGSPMSLIYAGFAGALTSTSQVGDVLVADVIVDEAGHQWPTTWPTAPCEPTRCRLLTVDRLVASPVDKRQLGERYGAQAVEMEAAHVAAQCALHGVPFGCVRAISDAVDTSLSPALVHLLSASRVSVTRLVAQVLRRPTMLRELLRLQRDTRRAAQQLAVALHGLLKLPPA